MVAAAMAVTMLSELYQHMEWADATVWSAVLATEQAWADVRLRELLHHTHVVQHAFLRTWRGEPGGPSFPTFDTPRELMAWGRLFHQDASPELARVGPDALTAPMPLPWADMVEQALGRPPGMTTMGETVLQVALHTLYHRGQVNMRLRELGGTPPLVDYIAWLWFDRPGANWPMPQ
jgi:uncharacterized damage-inducible protein DinB